MKYFLVIIIIFANNTKLNYSYYLRMNEILGTTAKKGLENNIIIVDSKAYVTAGAVQFRTIWIRDFGFVASILHRLKYDDVIINTINLYLNNLKKDSHGHLYGPKCFDTMNPEWRTVKASIRRIFKRDKNTSGLRHHDPLSGKLHPYMYKDSRGSVAIDSNIMILLASVSQENIIKKHHKILLKLLEWYPKENGLVIQQKYSDFQDSQRREGVLFMINLLYYVAIREYEKLGFNTRINLVELKRKIINTFYDKERKIFRSQKDHDYICLLDNLLAIHYDFLPGIYKGLKESKLWKGSKLRIPGFPTYPNNTDVHIQVALADLNNYHNDTYWGWLMAFSGICAFKSGDAEEGIKIYNILSKIAKRDGVISEIYSPEKDFPIFESVTYSSERPFTMSCCYSIELCDAYTKYS